MQFYADPFAEWRKVRLKAAAAQIALVDAEVRSALFGTPGPSPADRANLADLRCHERELLKAAIDYVRDRARQLDFPRNKP